MLMGIELAMGHRVRLSHSRGKKPLMAPSSLLHTGSARHGPAELWPATQPCTAPCHSAMRPSHPTTKGPPSLRPFMAV